MKGQAVLSGEQHQRKEARRKENVTMPTETFEGHDRKPEVCRAAIYLCEFGTDEPDLLRNVPSIDQQRMHCRCLAAMMCAEVVGEFVDEQRFWEPSQPGLRRMLELAANGRPVDYLIVYSKDRLARDCAEMCEVAWRLGNSGTAVMAADEHRVPLWFEM